MPDMLWAVLLTKAFTRLEVLKRFEVVEMIADNIYDNALDKRYVQHIKDNFPASLSLEELKEKGI